MTMSRSPLVSIQYLRGLAALMVVLHHVRGPMPWLFSPLKSIGFGRSGVDIFFVISGFIMLTAARNEPVATFCRRRIVRVVPLYWLVTLGLLIMILLRGQEQSYGLSLGHVVTSLFFIPAYNPVHVGRIWPLVVPGWTLLYEFAFYGLFAIGLAVRRPFAVALPTLLLLPLVGAMSQFTNPVLRVLTDMQLLEFATGLLIAWVWSRRAIAGLGLLLPIGLALLAVPDLIGGQPFWWRLSGATAIVVGALSLEATYPNARPIPWLKRLGDASFAIYLIHYNLLNPVRVFWSKIPLTGWPQFLSFVIVATAASIVAGMLVHWLVERPLLSAMRGRRAERPATAPG